MSAKGCRSASIGKRRGSQARQRKKGNTAYKDETVELPDTLPYQRLIGNFYLCDKVQIFVASLIFLNFFIAAIKAELVPPEYSTAWQVFIFFEYFFGIAFAIELFINMYGHFFILFFKSGWNLFDFVIVIVSLMAIGLEELPGISVLRLFRAFRVFRLFKRIPTLRSIINGIMASMTGVCNAFILLFILMGIWSIMGVEFFGVHKIEWFGTFFRALFTLWQVMSMDSWSSQIARGIIYEHHMPLASVYFVSYLFIVGIVMANVVVAILLDKYLEAVKEMQEEDRRENEDGREDELEDLDLTPVFVTNLPEKLRNLEVKDQRKLVKELLTMECLEKMPKVQPLIHLLLDTRVITDAMYSGILRMKCSMAMETG